MDRENKNTISRRDFLMAGGVGSAAALLAACGYKPNEELPTGTLVSPTVRPVTPTLPSTETSTATVKPTSTETSTPTPEPTNTSTPDAPPFVPEGFSEGPLGLMRNPVTGKDAFGFNPEADWGKLREGIIKGLWEANKANEKNMFVYPKSDASRYGNADDFYDKVTAKRILVRMGYPVRDPQKKFDKSRVDQNYINSMRIWVPSGFLFEIGEFYVDEIELQVANPPDFQKLVDNKDWMDPNNKIVSLGINYPNVDKAICPVLFDVNKVTNRLRITSGAYLPYHGIVAGPQFDIGDYDPTLHQKYPNNFLPNGLGTKSNDALSYIIGTIPKMLHNIPDGERSYVAYGGGKAKTYSMNHIYVGIRDITGYDKNSWYVNPPIYKFTN